MTQEQVGLAAQDARMQQWMGEKQSSFGNNAATLRLNDGDLVIFHFASSGVDGDRLFKGYRSHIFPMVGSRGGKYNETRYCAVQNGDGQDCRFCQMGHTNIKERMSMWLLVAGICHTYMPQPQQGQQLPQWPLIQYEGRNWYWEEVNAWKAWHNSAWRDSPWTDICRSQQRLGTLHTMQYEILSTGAQMQRRYKLIELAGTPPMNPEFYQQAWNTLTPIPDLLREEMARNVAWNPNQQQGQQPQGQPGFASMPQAGAIPFTPIAQSAPPLQVPSALPSGIPVAPVAAAPPPLAVAAPPPPATFQPQAPAAVSAPPAPPQAPAPPPTSPAPVAPPIAPPAAPTGPSIPPTPPAMPPAPSNPAGLQPVEPAPDDGSRPMRRMF